MNLRTEVSLLLLFSFWGEKSAEGCPDFADVDTWKLCASGDCVYKWTRCPCATGERRCKDGSCLTYDESCPTTKCGIKILCADGSCANSQGRCICDRFCNDGSCVRWGVRCPDECKEGYMKCADGSKCVRKLYKCDGSDDCADGSDEKDCQSIVNTSFPVSGVFNKVVLMATIVGVVLFLILIGGIVIGVCIWQRDKRRRAQMAQAGPGPYYSGTRMQPVPQNQYAPAPAGYPVQSTGYAPPPQDPSNVQMRLLPDAPPPSSGVVQEKGQPPPPYQ